MQSPLTHALTLFLNVTAILGGLACGLLILALTAGIVVCIVGAIRRRGENQ